MKSQTTQSEPMQKKQEQWSQRKKQNELRATEMTKKMVENLKKNILRDEQEREEFIAKQKALKEMKKVPKNMFPYLARWQLNAPESYKGTIENLRKYVKQPDCPEENFWGQLESDLAHEALK
ncbi:MAG: hypothetical protein WC604_03080 [Candidatus Gracilibacteria bacterium]